MQILGVHHVSINVDDVAAALAFYTEDLGLRVREDRPELGIDGAWLDAGGQQIHLVAGARSEVSGPHFALQVSGLDAIVAELRGRGLEVTEPPQALGLPHQAAFVVDPCGNLIELHQPA